MSIFSKNNKATPSNNNKYQRQSFSKSLKSVFAPGLIKKVINSAGKPLDHVTRSKMESKFGYDFKHVRVHVDSQADKSAQAVNARAFTIGNNIVFATEQFDPSSGKGRKLLAHELAHVVQQNGQNTNEHINVTSLAMEMNRPQEAEAREASHAVENGSAVQPLSTGNGISIQREEAEEEKAKPENRSSENLSLPPSLLKLLPESRLRIDPEIEAQMRAIRFSQEFLRPERISPSLFNIDPALLLQTQSPPFLEGSDEESESKEPLVPPGKGPEKPRPGTTGDILKALGKTPAVDKALAKLRSNAKTEIQQNWRQLSTGEKTLIISSSAAIAGSSLAALLSNEESLNSAIGLIEGLNIPAPFVQGLSFKFRVTGDNPTIQFNLDLGALLR